MALRLLSDENLFQRSASFYYDAFQFCVSAYGPLGHPCSCSHSMSCRCFGCQKRESMGQENAGSVHSDKGPEQRGCEEDGCVHGGCTPASGVRPAPQGEVDRTGSLRFIGEGAPLELCSISFLFVDTSAIEYLCGTAHACNAGLHNSLWCGGFAMSAPISSRQSEESHFPDLSSYYRSASRKNVHFYSLDNSTTRTLELY